MDSHALIERLGANAPVFRSLLEGVDAVQAGWKPRPEKWSILEVVNHLVDEEREDFRRRLDLTLHRPADPWPKIDPVGWVTDRNYADREIGASVEAFLREREASLQWLRALPGPSWDQAHIHPVFGAMKAGDLLAAWVAHDFLHLRQLVRLHYEHALALSSPYSTGYAGDW
jgi:hypothetical protein